MQLGRRRGGMRRRKVQRDVPDSEVRHSQKRGGATEREEDRRRQRGTLASAAGRDGIGGREGTASTAQRSRRKSNFNNSALESVRDRAAPTQKKLPPTAARHRLQQGKGLRKQKQRETRAGKTAVNGKTTAPMQGGRRLQWPKRVAVRDGQR